LGLFYQNAILLVRPIIQANDFGGLHGRGRVKAELLAQRLMLLAPGLRRRMDDRPVRRFLGLLEKEKFQTEVLDTRINLASVRERKIFFPTDLLPVNHRAARAVQVPYPEAVLFILDREVSLADAIGKLVVRVRAGVHP